MALPGLTDAQRVQVGGGARRQNSVIGCSGRHRAGVSGLIPADDRWIALGSEGGHASFAPQDEREDPVLQYARKKFPHVSFERVRPGMEIIYRAPRATRSAWPRPSTRSRSSSARMRATHSRSRRSNASAGFSARSRAASR